MGTWQSPGSSFLGSANNTAEGLSSGRIVSLPMGSAMLFAQGWAAAENAFWTAVSQLFVVGVAGFVANIIYRRYRDLSTARQELLKNIDEFSHALYKPRKLYQVMIDCTTDLLPTVCTPNEREVRRLDTIHEALADLVSATGRFRTFQVEIIRLYGYNMDLLSHYLAIWRYLKFTRRCMERGVSLYLPGEQPGSEDAFYNLFDAFRFRISVARFVYNSPAAAKPPDSIIAEMRRQGDEVFDHYFNAPRTESETDAPMPTIPQIEVKSWS